MTITQQRTDRGAVTVRPLSGYTGAEIGGVDLTEPLEPETVAQIRAALLEWKVVFFRNQAIDHAAQIRFGRYFGEVTLAHPYEGDTAPSGYPEIHTVSPAAYDERYGANYRRRETNPNGPGWHADVTPLINPPAASILRAEVVPPYGGDTQFTNVAKAFEGLSDPLKHLIKGLSAEHRFGYAHGTRRHGEPIEHLLDAKPLAAIHPVVRIHPETGEPVIYVNPGFTKQIVELAPRESRHLLDLLFEQVGRPEYTVRFKWEAGSVAFWDNRSALHLAPRDYEHVGHDRVLHRITLVGDVPIGADGRRSVLVDGEPFLAA
jgi:alpha-ketoglutarate-dependent taurine dioxygenase